MEGVLEGSTHSRDGWKSGGVLQKSLSAIRATNLQLLMSVLLASQRLEKDKIIVYGRLNYTIEVSGAENIATRGFKSSQLTASLIAGPTQK